MRSYFDRWKAVGSDFGHTSLQFLQDVDDGSHEKEPTWQRAQPASRRRYLKGDWSVVPRRLRVERKPLIAKSASEPFLPKFQPQGLDTAWREDASNLHDFKCQSRVRLQGGRYGPWHPVF